MAVHVGGRGPGHVARVMGGWSPDRLGASLLGWWDAERTDKLSLSGSSVTTWTDVVGAYGATQSVSGSKPRWDANAFGGVLNKCTNVSANPQNTTGLTKSGDAAAVLSVVDDSAALAAAGLSAYGPNVYKLDNSLGTTQAFATPNGTTGNTNTHATVAWLRGGTGQLRNNGAFGTGGINFPASATYVRRSTTFAPSDTLRAMMITAEAGRIVYFTLNGLYEGSSAPSQDVVVNGAAAYGYGRPGVIFDGSDDELTLGSVPFPTGSSPSEIWVLSDQTAAAADTTTRYSLCYGGSSATLRRGGQRLVLSGVNRAAVQNGDGATSPSAADVNVDYSGRHVLRAVTTATGQRAEVDGDVGGTGSIVPTTGTTLTRLGANSATTASNFWQGIHSAVIVTSALSTDQAAQLLAYLKARGGIA